jgi:hypothetical protein
MAANREFAQTTVPEVRSTTNAPSNAASNHMPKIVEPSGGPIIVAADAVDRWWQLLTLVTPVTMSGEPGARRVNRGDTIAGGTAKYR